MKLNFNFPIKGLDGTDLKDSNAGKILANNLAGQPSGDIIKYWQWAQDIYAGKEIELDKSDTETLRNYIKTNLTLPIITKVQMLEAFKE